MTIDQNRRRLRAISAGAVLFLLAFAAAPAHASEASLILPDLNQARFFTGGNVDGGISGKMLLTWGLTICLAGLVFGLIIYEHLRKLPVHRSMLEVSELIYETCKTYLKTQGKFILVLWVFIAIIMVVYFGFLSNESGRHATASAHP